MTRLQEAQEWAGRLTHNFFFVCQPIPDSKSKIKWTLWKWMGRRDWAVKDADTRLLALAFAATAPEEFR